MKNVIATVFAASLVAAPAFADTMPTNESATGAKGAVVVEAPVIVAESGGLNGIAIAAGVIGLAALAAAAGGSDSAVVTTGDGDGDEEED